jgi:hypothetical protein
VTPADVPSRETGFVVFAQRTDARVELEAWSAHAERFFATRVGLAEDKKYAPDIPVPLVDSVSFVIAPLGESPGVRLAFARPRDEEDLALAEAADARAGFTGLALLARRCPTVWLVARETEGDGLALRLAAILASVLLGPILDTRSGELYGVKTAREKITACPQVPGGELEGSGRAPLDRD